MTQQAGADIGTFVAWVDHFEQNKAVHAEVDAAIAFDGQCDIPDSVRPPLIESIRRFQLGESGDGEQLLGKAERAGDPDYLRAAQLFVAEEQQHAALLMRLLGYLGGQPMQTHWSDAVFVRLRRLMGLRTELMVLTVAEVVALSYYGGLATLGPRCGRAGGRRPNRRRRTPARPVPGGSAPRRLRPVTRRGEGIGVRVLVAYRDRRHRRGVVRPRTASRRDRLPAHALHP